MAVTFCFVFVSNSIFIFLSYDCICFWCAELNMIQKMIYWIMSSC